MQISVNLNDKFDIQEAVELLSGFLDTSKEETPETKKVTKKTVKKEKAKVEEEPEEKVEIEDDEDDPFAEDDDDKTKYTKGDVVKALNDYVKSHDREAAIKILKTYTPNGKVAEIDSDDYAAVIASLI